MKKYLVTIKTDIETFLGMSSHEIKDFMFTLVVPYLLESENDNNQIQ